MSDVVYPWAEVFINGQSVGVHDVEVTSAISGDLPGRLDFGSGITQRTGTIRWDKVVGKGGLLLSPYFPLADSGFKLPAPGDRVVIRMGVKDASEGAGLTGGEIVFTGKVDTTEVPHGGFPVTQIVDDIDRLNQVVRLTPYKHHMPPAPNTQEGWYTHNHLTPDAVLGFLAAKCGYHVTPPPSGTVYLSAPMQGTTLEAGKGTGRMIRSQLEESDTVSLPEFTRTKRGLALAKGLVSYDPGFTTPPQRLVFSVLVGANHAGRAVIRARLKGFDTQLHVIIESDRGVSVQVGESAAGAIIPGPDEYVSVAFLPNGQTEIATASTKVAYQLPSWENGVVENLTVTAYGNCAVAGINVSGYTADSVGHPALAFKQTAFIDCGYPYPLHLSRSIRDEKAIDVIEEICKAICCYCYLDGEGRLIITYSRTGYGKPVAGTLSAKTDVKTYRVKQDSQLAARNAVIKYKTVAGEYTAKAGGSFVTLWEGASTQLDAGEPLTQIIGPQEGKEEWFEVDESFSYPPYDMENFLRKNGSFHGFTVTRGTPGQATESWAGGTTRLRRITPWAWELTSTPTSACQTKVPEISGVHPSMWGTGLPVIRGGAKIQIIDAEPVTVTGGPENAADLTHEAGTWVTETRASDIAQHIMTYARDPLPVITGVEVFFNPAIEVGQRWNLDLLATAGVRLQVFVLEVKRHPASDTASISCRVLSNLTGRTWGTIAAEHATWQEVKATYPTYHALKEGA